MSEESPAKPDLTTASDDDVTAYIQHKLGTKLEELKARYGEVVFLRTAAGVVVIRRPSRQEYQRWMSTVRQDMARANEVLSKQCLLDPDLATFETWLESKYGILTAMSDALTDLAGATGKLEAKKL